MSLEALPQPQGTPIKYSGLRTLLARLPKLNIPQKVEKKFTKFMELPPELRLMVWDQVACQPRNIYVYDVEDTNNSDPYRFNRCLEMPPILLACKESRNIGLQHYDRVVEGSLRTVSPPHIWDPKVNSDPWAVHQRTVSRVVWVNFRCDNFVIAEEIQDLGIFDIPGRDSLKDVVLNLSRKDLSRIEHCSMRTDLCCGGRLLYLGAFFRFFDVNSIKTFTVNVGSKWQCLCGPEVGEALIAMSSRVHWKKCLGEKIAEFKKGVQRGGFVYPIEFLWKHAWDTSITSDAFTLEPLDEDTEEKDGGETGDEEEA